jgi:hypothetical protein
MNTGHVAQMREDKYIQDIGGKARTRKTERQVENIKWILERQDSVIWAGLIWLRIGTSDKLL